MTDRPIPPEVLREFAAMWWLVQHHPCSAAELRLSNDKAGTVRHTMRVEGITASELAAALGQVERGA